MKQMWRLTIGLALVCPILPVSLPAQASAHRAPAAATESSAALIGTWEGNYTSDHAPTAPMRLSITHEKEWSAKLEISMGDGQMQNVPVRNVTYASGTISFGLELMQQACQATSALRENALQGTVVCGPGSISFVLSKK